MNYIIRTILKYFQKKLDNIIQKINKHTNDINIINNIILDLSRDKLEYKKYEGYEEYLIAEISELVYFKNKKTLIEQKLIELKNKKINIEKKMIYLKSYENK